MFINLVHLPSTREPSQDNMIIRSERELFFPWQRQGHNNSIQMSSNIHRVVTKVPEITEVKDMGGIIRAVVDVGVPFVVALTKRSYEDMELAPGTRVCIVFKASATHLF